MRVLGLVPARGGSRRIERKNLAVLGGKTLVKRALETAIAADCFEPVAISSEEPAILAEAEDLPVMRVRRPIELAADAVLAYDVVVHSLEVLEPQHGRFEAVAVIQCTSPLTAPEDLSGAVEMLQRTRADSVVSIVRVDNARHPLKLKRLEHDRLVPFLEDDRMMPSHELPELWVRNGSIYVSQRDVIEEGHLISDDVRGYQMPRERSIDIDTPTDLAFAQYLMERRHD